MSGTPNADRTAALRGGAGLAGGAVALFLPVAVVGHEPHVGRLVTWLLTGSSESHVVFKKGGACLLDLGVRPSAGGALLHWLLTPGQLRAIAD